MFFRASEPHDDFPLPNTPSCPETPGSPECTSEQEAPEIATRCESDASEVEPGGVLVPVSINDPTDSRMLTELEASREIARLKRRIGAHHRKMRSAFRKSVELARSLGEDFLALKGLVGHGGWTRTLFDLSANYGISSRTANLYMSVARHWDQITATMTDERVSELSLRQVQQLLSRNAALFSHGSPEWLTPVEIIEAVRRTFGGVIDCDPAAEDAKRHIPARQHFSKAEDGLQNLWHGKVYINPPYGSQNVEPWVAHTGDQLGETLDEAILLLPARTDTQCFAKLADMGTTFVFVTGRLKFSDHKNSAPFPSVLAYLGSDPERFVEHCRPLGFAVRPVANPSESPEGEHTADQ